MHAGDDAMLARVWGMAALTEGWLGGLDSMQA
jgi:hypothetical protein